MDWFRLRKLVASDKAEFVLLILPSLVTWLPLWMHDIMYAAFYSTAEYPFSLGVIMPASKLQPFDLHTFRIWDSMLLVFPMWSIADLLAVFFLDVRYIPKGLVVWLFIGLCAFVPYSLLWVIAALSGLQLLHFLAAVLMTIAFCVGVARCWRTLRAPGPVQ